MNETRSKYKGGRKPKLNPVVANYTVRFNAEDNNRFLALFEQSAMKTMAHFIAARIFDQTFKVVQINQAEHTYYCKLSTLYNQFRAVFNKMNRNLKKII